METHILKMQLFNQGGGSQKELHEQVYLKTPDAATRSHIEDYPRLGERFVYTIFTWSVARGIT